MFFENAAKIQPTSESKNEFKNKNILMRITAGNYALSVTIERINKICKVIKK